MGTIFQRHGKLALAVGLVALVVSTSVLVGYFASRARALGMPGTNPLYYSGLLTDTAGKPLTNPQTIVLDLYDTSTAGNKKCSTTSIGTPLTQGRFRIGLDKACTAALRDTSDLWVEVTVGSTTMPRNKIGAAPYVANPEIVTKDGDASFTIHSNTDTPTNGSKMLVLQTGNAKSKVNEILSIDNQGSLLISTPSTNTTTSKMVLPEVYDIYSTPWTDYGKLLTIDGFSSLSTRNIHVKKIGRTVFVSYQIYGQSNSTTFTFTLPYTSSTMNTETVSGYITDNGIHSGAGRLMISGGTKQVNIFKAFPAVAWTTSGIKAAYGQFWYESSQ